MADSVVTNVTTLDIQMLDADRKNATTIKLDFPKDNVTREQVSAAMQPAFTNGWLLTNSGSVAMYLGDVIVNQSIKTKLDGEDFYITPNELIIETNTETEVHSDLTVAGATFMGYDYYSTGFSGSGEASIVKVQIANNGLTMKIYAKGNSTRSIKYNFYVIVQGEKILVPVWLNSKF